MRSSSNRGKNHRRLKTYLAAMATTAALGGAGQLLLPASAGAMISNGADCTYQDAFWIDQFACFEEEEPSGGSGGGSGGGGGGGTTSPTPPPEQVHDDGREEEIEVEEKPPAKVGGPAQTPVPDGDNKGGRDGGKRPGGTVYTCKKGQKAWGCVEEVIDCVIDDDHRYVVTQAECDRLNDEFEKLLEARENAKLNRAACSKIARRVIVILENWEPLEEGEEDPGYGARLKELSDRWNALKCDKWLPPRSTTASR